MPQRLRHSFGEPQKCGPLQLNRTCAKMQGEQVHIGTFHRLRYRLRTAKRPTALPRSRPANLNDALALLASQSRGLALKRWAALSPVDRTLVCPRSADELLDNESTALPASEPCLVPQHRPSPLPSTSPYGEPNPSRVPISATCDRCRLPRLTVPNCIETPLQPRAISAELRARAPSDSGWSGTAGGVANSCSPSCALGVRARPTS
jgi:hypothetical protein